VRYVKSYAVGVSAVLAFCRIENAVKPVLILKDAYNLSETELSNLYRNACIG